MEQTSDGQSSLLPPANYGSGSAVTFDLDPTTHLLTSKAPEATFQFHRSPEGSIGPVTSRQDHSYAHQVQPDPTGRWVYVCDLGADRIWRMKVPSSGKAAEVKRVGHTVVAEGSGPRHISFYHDSKTNQSYGYLASELSTHLTAFKVNSTNGALDMIGQPHLAVPKGTPLGGNKKDGPKRTTSEVAISPDGKVVYVGTRGDAVEDHVSIFDRDTTTGAVQWREWVASGGRNLRHVSTGG
jgi:6-phosphogluconolactonase